MLSTGVKDFIYSFLGELASKRVEGGAEERDKQTDSVLSTEPATGLYLTTLTS